MKQEGDPASQISLVREGLQSSVQVLTCTLGPWKPQSAVQRNPNFSCMCLRLCLLH